MLSISRVLYELFEHILICSLGASLWVVLNWKFQMVIQELTHLFRTLRIEILFSNESTDLGECIFALSLRFQRHLTLELLVYENPTALDLDECESGGVDMVEIELGEV